jgi:transcriptional regulator of arginine metabolism
MNKALRQRAVLETLKQGPIANQEDLQRALRKRGFKVGQATLSRDIHVKTIIGSAQPVAAALDEQEWGEVVGTIAGDDAILIVCPDKDAAKKVGMRIGEMLG